MIGIYSICLNINSVSAYDQICLRLSPDPPAAFGEGIDILKLGIMDYGNYHMALSGTDMEYSSSMPSKIDSIGLVHGNAEIVNGMVEVSLTGSGMSSDNKTASNYFYHLRLDMTTLSGAYTLRSHDSSTNVRNGSVSVVSCSGLP